MRHETPPTERFAIYGCGGMGREVADIVRTHGPDVAVIFVTDRGGDDVDGIAVLSPEALTSTDRIVYALGNSADRRRLSESLPTIAVGQVVAPSAYVSPHAVLGEGAIVGAFAFISNGVRAGRHCLANVHAQVSHDCTLGDFVTISPHASINGWVVIEDDAFIGAGAVIRNGARDRPLVIGRGAVVGIGAVVLGDVEPGAAVAGVPARRLATAR